MAHEGDPRQTYRAEVGRLESAAGDTITTEDAEAIKRFVLAHDGEDITVSDADAESKAARTLKRYTSDLRLTARRLSHYDTTLLDAETDTVNRLMQDLRRGDHPDAPERGHTTNSVSNKQGTVRKFLRFSEDATANADEVAMYDREDTKVDERDVLDRDEIEACREAANRPRNRALFELMLYTGQRVRAIQTLRIRDLDFDEGATGAFWLNEDAAGLKGAEGKRPMLGAHEALRDYVRNYHPCPDDPDAAVFTVLPDYNPDPELGDELHHTAINRAIRQIGERAGVPRLHPHLLRHTAVTIMHREYDIDESHIKYIIGHEEGSTVMETTYSHLQDDDHVKAIEVGAGYREEDEESSMTPGNCPKCDARLDPTDRACSRCGAILTPDAHAASEQIQNTFYEAQRDATDEKESLAVDDLKRELQENPELMAELLQEIANDTE